MQTSGSSFTGQLGEDVLQGSPGARSHLHLRTITNRHLAELRVAHKEPNVKFTNAEGLLYIQTLLAK